jgi:hypothetical protein
MKKPMLRIVGGWAVFLSAFCFYLSTVVIRWSQAEVSIAPSYFVFARFLLGLLVVCAIMVYRRQRPRPRSYHLLLGRTVGNCGWKYHFFDANFTGSLTRPLRGRRPCSKFDRMGGRAAFIRRQCRAGGTSQSAGVETKKDDT